MKKRTIVLASSSPRRKEILERAGVRFIVDAANIEEDMTRALSAQALVKQLAFEKASFVALRHPNAIVIAADTVASYGTYIWSKAETVREAKLMLNTLNGTTHTVWTGFCIIDTKSGRYVKRAVQTKLTLRKLTPKQIADYLATGEPLQGAGGYNVQAKGQALIEDVRGDYNNILGFPLATVLKELEKLQVRV